jgi:hypothetical protein
VGEDSASNNKVIRTMQLEEKKLSGSDGLKVSSTRRLPKVDLLKVGLTPKQIEPLSISHADVSFNHRVRPPS